jgi:hypothetical protein
MAGRGGRSQRTVAVWAACTISLLAILPTGCSSNPLRNDDPLLGKSAPVVPVPEVGSVATGPGTPGPLPVLAGSNGTTSTAALASGSVPALPTDRNLRIGPPPSAKLNGTAGTSRAPAVPVTLSKPEPVGEKPPVPAPTPGPLPTAPVTLAGGVTVYVQSVDHGIKILEDRGLKAFRLELQRDTGQWRCTCSLPDRRNPSLKRTYDTTARDRVAAVRAVIEKVEKENPEP